MEQLEILRKLTAQLPAFPTHIGETDRFKEYAMDAGTCFGVPLYETETIGIHRWFNSPGVFPEHSHPETKIIIVYDGEMELIVNGDHYFLKPMMVYTIAPETVHQARFLVDTNYLTITKPPAPEFPHGR